jgi:hypothetical protein
MGVQKPQQQPGNIILALQKKIKILYSPKKILEGNKLIN